MVLVTGTLLTAMRALRSALFRPLSMRAIPVRSSALMRALSQRVSEQSTPLSKHMEQFVPTAIIFTLILSIAGVAAYYYGELMSLKMQIQSVSATLKSEMAGVVKEVDATMKGTTEKVDATMQGTTKEINAKIAGIEKAADLKVRFLQCPRCTRATDPHTNPISQPFAVQGQVGRLWALRHFFLRTFSCTFWHCFSPSTLPAAYCAASDMWGSQRAAAAARPLGCSR